MKTLKLFTFALLLGLFATSCKKLEVKKPETPAATTNISNLKAADNFNWKTTKDYQFQIQGFINGVVKIVSPSGTVYYSGLIKSATPSQIKVTIPSFEKTVIIRYLANERSVGLGQGVITQTFNSFN